MIPQIDVTPASPVVPQHHRSTSFAPIPFKPMPFEPRCPGRAERARRGRTAYFSGLAAEETVAREYQRRGAKLRRQRHRTPEGEIDLVLREGDMLVFVEVKKRKHGPGPDSPVSQRQWRRLENAAEHYMMALFDATGIRPFFRFDVAIVDGRGRVTIIENARVVEEF